MKYYLRRNSHRILKAFLLLSVVAALLLGLGYYLNNRGEIVRTNEKDPSDTSAAVISIESRVLNFGSIRWGDSANSTAESFNQLDAFGRTDYDAWVGNLACQIEQSTGCREGLVGDLKKWFDVVGVGDLGSDSSKSVATSKALVSGDVQFFGRLASAEKSDNCGVVALPGRYLLDNQSYRQASVPIVFCGVNGTETLSADLLQKISSASKVLPVWVYTLDDSGAQQEVLSSQYRSYIDAGADMVFGVSKDSLATAETYKGKLIAYSLGNFMGPSPLGPNPSLAALIGITIRAERTDDTLRWTEISKTCTGYSDLCLEAGISEGLDRPNYQYSYALQGVSRLDSYNPKPTESFDSSEVARIMDWVEVVGALSKVTSPSI